jgi:hypothetical protein
MALAAKAGTFNAPASGGTQVTGLGFRPATIVLWTENATGDNVVSNGLDVSFGVWSRPRPTVAARAQSAWVHSAHASGSANASAGLNPTRPISNAGWTVASITERVDNDGFTVTYGSGPPSGTRIHYLALSADALSTVLTVNIPAGGAVGSRIAVRGAGFTPTSIIAIAQLLASGTSKTIGLGVADMFGNQWAMSGSTLDAADPMNTDRAWSESSVINLVNSAGALASFKLVGYVSDGFDLEIVAPPATPITMYALVLANVLTRVTVESKPTGAAPAAQSIVDGFAPKAMMFGGTHQTAVGAAAHHRGFLGAAGGAARASGAWSDTDALATSDTKGVGRIDVGASKRDNQALTTEASTDVTLTSTGATLSWTPNDAVASRFGTFAIGNLAHALGGDSIVATEAAVSQWLKPQWIFGSTSEVNVVVEGRINPFAALGGDAVVDTVFASKLAMTHALGGNAVVDTIAASFVALRAVLGGSAAISTVAESVVWIPTPLGGEILVETLTDGRLALQHTIGGSAVVDTELSAYFTLVLPFMRAATSNEIPGTVNWHVNPGAEDGLTGWSAFGAATIDDETLTVWDGGRSVAVTMNGIGAGEGVAIEGVSGLDLTDDSKMVWATVYAAGPELPVDVYARALYTDGTTETGDHDTAMVLHAAPNWSRLVAPPIVLNPAKRLLRVEMVVASLSGVADTFYVDGAQIEEDRGGQPTPWTTGNYGFNVGVWTGAPNRSMAMRQPIQIQPYISHGHGGLDIIEARLFRATWDNQFIEDITEAVLSGKIIADPERDVTWSFDCTMTKDGYDELRPNLDWVAPCVKVVKADGTVLGGFDARGQLGLYFVAPSAHEYDEHRATVKLSCFDPLWLVARQGLTGNLIASPGVDRGRILRSIIDGAALTGGQDEKPGARKRYSIPDFGKEFKRRREWPRDQNRLQLFNVVAKSSGAFPAYTTKTGYILTRKRGETRLKRREPVKSWAANVPSGYVPKFAIHDIAKLGNEVIGRIPTTPKAHDMFNEILVVNDDAPMLRVHVRGRIKSRGSKHPRVLTRKKSYDPNDPHKKDWEDDPRARNVRRVKLPYLDDEATALQLAEAFADELSAKTEFVTIVTLIDPEPEFVRETVSTAIWDLHDHPVAVGHWLVNRVQYSLWPSTPTMTLELSRIGHDQQDADIEIEGTPA